MRNALLAGLAAASLVVLPAAAQTPLRASLNSDIRSTQPGGNRDFNTDSVILHVVEGLVALNEHAAPVPMLAEKMELSGDGRTYTFTLRQGVTFHNGAPLTSAEVLWSLRRYMDPATNWRCLPDLNGRSGLAKITEMAAPDARTVTITLEKPAALFLSTIARPDCGSTGVLHPSSVGADGAWVKPVGTGPYSLGEWRRGQYVELERFEGYAALPGERDGFAGGKRALMPRIRFVTIPDSSAAKAALLAGNVDVMTDVPGPELPDLRANRAVQVLAAPSMGVTALLLQTRDPLLKDERIRRAIALALDVPELVTSIVGDDAPENPSPLPSASPFRSEAQTRRPARDLAAAKRLLAEAGYRGQPIRMITNRRYPNVYDASVAAQAMAADAGIKIELEVLDWATELDRYTRGDYQAMAFIYSPRLDPSLSYEMISGPKDTQPRKVWDDPQALELIQRSMTVTDEAERQRIFDRLYGMFMQQVPMVVLYNQPDYIAVRQGVTGVRPWASGQTRLWGVARGG
ncbi:ABC transporter substrate-binding protein [Pararoseomonas indoligenes]|uniref:ABC transporter substrate-binding protein n=1 Tax=Roseomonas indoligenes TaxID=2820811 RepID=A0A940N0I3_9PROT|nr:ABC transporter substrate-binding protein [Pararoseomonas indoligenes]MBP0494537.1 ABC transporter substrate-binding protein [Pararoseomonas indoligenes]